MSVAESKIPFFEHTLERIYAWKSKGKWSLNWKILAQFLWPFKTAWSLISFPRNESVTSIVWGRYGEKILKTLCKFETKDYKLRKEKHDINLSSKWLRENVMPNFLKFSLANKDIPTEINSKKSSV